MVESLERLIIGGSEKLCFRMYIVPHVRGFGGVITRRFANKDVLNRILGEPNLSQECVVETSRVGEAIDRELRVGDILMIRERMYPLGFDLGKLRHAAQMVSMIILWFLSPLSILLLVLFAMYGFQLNVMWFLLGMFCLLYTSPSPRDRG